MTTLQPISFETDHARRLRRATFTGVITEPALFGAYEKLIAEPGYDPTLNDLVDMRAVTRLEVSSRGVRQLAWMFAQPELQAANKLAIVATENYIFGMARMYEIMSSETSEQIRVFREIEEAENWLAVKEDDGRL